MSEAYNPESVLYEQLEVLKLKLRTLAQKRDAATNNKDRDILERQLKEMEAQITTIKKTNRRKTQYFNQDRF